ncbi:hypothetical protein BN12_4150002 [Nostocoides japonicum T1-X7]|uniref:Uncharacterized protein n=1 Tax=Nostocoides japonicum T1-X7 TaxID=1194083 RepID=A0A077LZF7_9MICO|nr:hypothetical protein BN12_4150002 [Tetrasphaera japonica T1-X7]
MVPASRSWLARPRKRGLGYPDGPGVAQLAGPSRERALGYRAGFASRSTVIRWAARVNTT